MTDPYSLDAAYYDIVHADAPDDDIGLWLAFAGRTDRPVLEVGTGSGRVALALAAAGHTVTAIDPSDAMLAVARARAAAEGHLPLTFHTGDALSSDLEPDHFGLVIFPADVFLYLNTTDDQIATLEALAACMHFNATLILDLPGPAMGLDPATNGQPLLVFSGTDASGTALEAWHVHQDDLAEQTRMLTVRYETVEKNGLVRRQSSTHLLRYVYRYEVEHLLSVAGLVLSGVYGDYDLAPFTGDSERMIVLANRRGG